MRQHNLNRNFEIIINVLDNNKKCFPKIHLQLCCVITTIELLLFYIQGH